ncbi:hypothetical protein [Bacillus suaedae]|uniref:Uncharacterized protein n=1 Tax=Halalkalibacter suaedae TaxID=2822140 RepID=A0A940WYW2_9BACI|nr:hypothetical protein [Bacillus suaedae]MBP3953373.1 hypothetical protein [Bacillus suaedae]
MRELQNMMKLHTDLVEMMKYVRDQAKEETKLEVAECMLDYGIDSKLVKSITGIKRIQPKGKE